MTYDLGEALQPGEIVLERFRLLEQLGSHGSGVLTWRVEALRDGSTGGVLKLAPSGSSDAEDIEREAALLVAIPRAEALAAQLAPLLGHGRGAQWTWLLQADVGDLDLSRHWARHGVAWRDILDVGQAVAGALATLHRHGVLHRDVKEQNIVVADGAGPDRYWLVDLGIGRRLDHRAAVTTDLRGSHDRVPPEAVTAARKVGPRGDVFVLCKLLAQALVGSPNTAWPDDVDAQVTACGLDPANPRHLALVRLLARGMRLDPTERPSARELAEAFADIRAGRIGAPRSRWWLPVASFAAGGGVVAAILLWPEAQTPPSVAFEDASATWNIRAPAPDAQPKEPGAEPTSGLFYQPTLLDAGDSVEVYLPRSSREYSAMPAALRRDLIGRITPSGLDWRYSELPLADGNTNWIERGDFDGDGHLDTLVTYRDEGWHRSVRLLLASEEEPVELERMRFPAMLPQRWGTGVLGWRPPHLDAAEASHWDQLNQGLPASSWHISWLDVDRDGIHELLVEHEIGLSLLRWQAERWRQETILESTPPSRTNPRSGAVFGIADLDGDGDEDVLTLGDHGRSLKVFTQVGGGLSEVHGLSLPILDAHEHTTLGLCTIQTVDLDGDGLPELLLPSGGLARKGAFGAKLWRNLGGMRFERVELPDTLSEPHDGCEFLAVDIDQDGVMDLLDFSINDEERLTPTHRAWRGVGQVHAAQWRLRLTTPDGLALPVGTHLESTGTRPWVRVIRDGGPLWAPSWLEGDLLVTLPTGEILVADLGQGLTKPRAVTLSRARLPALWGFQVGAIAPGVPVVHGEDLLFHAKGTSWELALYEGRAAVLRRDDGLTEIPAAPIRAPLGCPTDDRCLFLESRAVGGYAASVLDLQTGKLERLGTQGDSAIAALSSHGRAWSVSGHVIRERSLEDYTELAPGQAQEPRIACDGLGFDGVGLACCSDEWNKLVVFEPDTLEATLQVDLPIPAQCDVVPVSGGWLTTTYTGLARIDDDGSLTMLRLGEPSRLLRSTEGVWAIGAHRALLLDTTGSRVLGGLAAPDLGAALPVQESGGQLAEW